MGSSSEFFQIIVFWLLPRMLLIFCVILGIVALIAGLNSRKAAPPQRANRLRIAKGAGIAAAVALVVALLLFAVI